jgi:hypothetical protein
MVATALDGWGRAKLAAFSLVADATRTACDILLT